MSNVEYVDIVNILLSTIVIQTNVKLLSIQISVIICTIILNLIMSLKLA